MHQGRHPHRSLLPLGDRSRSPSGSKPLKQSSDSDDGELCNQDERASVNAASDNRSKLVESIVLFSPPFIRDFPQLESSVPR